MTASLSSPTLSITACRPVSWTAAMTPVDVAVPDTGRAPWRVTVCSPWRIWARGISGAPCTGLTVSPSTPCIPRTTAKVGSTCWGMPCEFSVVNASSSWASEPPAPTPSA